MDNFTFDLPTNIHLGNGLFNKTADYISNVTDGSKVLLVTDEGMEKIGLADKLLKQLEKNGFEVKLFTKVVPNPKDADCAEGGEAARSFETDCIVALGGGSVIDAAKAIAVLQIHGGMPQDYAGRGNVPGPVKPLVAIPTTAGTGAEVTRSSVITDTKRKIKFTIKDVRIAPAAAIIDPELTYGLPASLTASTGMDALVHAIEAYTCKLSNPVSDGLAIQAMKHIYPNLRQAVEDGANEEARYQMMTGSTIAGMAFSHADVASVHCMAEAIGGLYDTPHGVANSMFLPYIIEFNAEADTYKHAEIARTLGIAGEKESDSAAAAALVKEVKQLAKDIKIPSFSSLMEARIEDFDYLAKSSFENGSTPSNAREISEEDYKNLFYKAFKEKL
ncbi:iron-containing alcohol dehydrogenase [Evansella sp. LMS18]|uniref:iron-containing alcohol dehydrogenase n=1 Tax=Evansella sp. LMS18 TaxID=2924033 RepID=UPI0020D027AE|nr:iron-containing alcohol dehydrogenase [Evansella sp. LMS18]UTR10436.1 iron-containing alcohol dehydrogenase [Evansella sp. LMS18]